MTQPRYYVPAYLRPGSEDDKAQSVDPLASWLPRVPDEADAMPDPMRSPLAAEHVAEGLRLRDLRDLDDAARAKPAAPWIGPALAARLGVESTTP